MNCTGELLNTLSELKRNRQTVKNELRNFSEGELMIVKATCGTEYFNVTYKNGVRIRKGIGSKPSQIYRLARKAYLEESLKRLDSAISILEAVADKFPELDSSDILKAMPKHFDILNQGWILDPNSIKGEKGIPHPIGDGSVQPIQLATTLKQMLQLPDSIMCDPDRIQQWFTMPYCENTSYPEHKTHVASNGLKTRSKSESLMIERYEAHGIAYHYDESCLIGYTSVSPDIIGVRKDGSVFIHEHAGLWTDDYIRRNERKFRLYENIGFVQGKNLLITFDDLDGNLNTRLMDELVADMYER